MRITPLLIILVAMCRSALGEPISGSVVRCDGDVTTSLQSAIEEARSSRQNVTLKASPPGAACILGRTITIPSAMHLAGVGHPMLKLLHSGTAFVGTIQSNGFEISGLTLDGTGASKASMFLLRGTVSGRLENVQIINPGDGIVLSEGTQDVVINHLVETGSRQHGITISDSNYNTVEDSILNDQAGFGVILNGNSHGNKLIRLKTTRSGLELVGMTWKTYNNVLRDSKASWTGDNCFSITGSYNQLSNLSGDHCAGNGITFYGSHNVLEGGQFFSNNQQYSMRSAWSAGIQFAQGFGGVAQYNVVRDVMVDDNQPHPTQQVGVMISSSLYQPWKALVQVAAGEERYVGLRLYRAITSGTTGFSPPESTGDAYDGGVSWKYINFFEGSTLPDHNRAENIVIGRFVRVSREDKTSAIDNIGVR